METYLRLATNAFAVSVAVVILIGSRSRSERTFRDYLVFTLMLIATIAVLACDSLAWLADGRAEPGWRFLNGLGNTLYFLINPFVPLAYMIYVFLQIREHSRRPVLRAILLSSPAAISGLLSLLTPLGGALFYFDAGNMYHRGPLFFVYAAVMAFYVLYIAAYVMIKRAALDRRSVIAFLLFPLGPVAAGVGQALAYGIAILWPAVVVSLLLIFINVQQRRLSIDYLSGAFNRRRLDEYLEERIRDARERRIKFAAFLADMDDFKRINDEHGHKVGDRAIVETVRIMRSGLRACDFLARFAGDEFVAVLAPCGEKDLDAIVTRVRARLVREGAWTGSCPPVAVSIGASIFDPDKDRDADAFVRRLDLLMYQEKTERKRARRITGHKSESPR